MPTTTLNRALLVIIFPGVVAVAPWLFMLMNWVQASSDFYAKCPLLVNVCLITSVVIIGCFFEGANSYFEDKWDTEKNTKYNIRKNWYDYLALVCTAEPVGFKYIARKVTGMYFELAMVWASLSFGVGAIAIRLLMLSANSTLFVWGGITILLAITAVASWYFWTQAKESHDVLCRCRQELNVRLYAHRQPPFLSGCFS